MRVNFRGLTLGAFAALATADPSRHRPPARSRCRRRAYTASVVRRAAPVLRHAVRHRPGRRPPHDRVPRRRRPRCPHQRSRVRRLGPRHHRRRHGQGAQRLGPDPLPTSTRPPSCARASASCSRPCRRDGSGHARRPLRLHRASRRPPASDVRDQARSASRRRRRRPSARLAEARARHDRPPGALRRDVILHSAADEARLPRRRLPLRGPHRRPARPLARAARLRERRGARSAQQATALPPPPSGRATYRTLPEFPAGDEGPRGRQSWGSSGLHAPAQEPPRGPRHHGHRDRRARRTQPDGRPEYVQVGGHHAREWPASEATLEFGIDLINAYKNGGDPRSRRHRPGRAHVRHPRAQRRRLQRVDRVRGPQPRRLIQRPGRLPAARPGDQSIGSGAYKRKTCSRLGGNRANERDPLPRPDLRRRHPDRVPRPRRRSRTATTAWSSAGRGPESGCRRARPTTGPRRSPRSRPRRCAAGLRDRQPSPARHQPHLHGPDPAPARHRGPQARFGPTRTGCGRSATRWRPRPATPRSSPTSSTTRPARPTTTSTGRSAVFSYTPEIGRVEFHPGVHDRLRPGVRGRGRPPPGGLR